MSQEKSDVKANICFTLPPPSPTIVDSFVANLLVSRSVASDCDAGSPSVRQTILSEIAKYKQSISFDAAEIEDVFVTSAFINARTSRGSTLLIRACERRFFEIVRILLCDFGAHASLTDQYNQTPLHALISGQSYFAFADMARLVETVRLLITVGGAAPNVRSSTGRTALYYACRHGWFEVASMLIREFNADVTMSSPLQAALENDQWDLIRLLIVEGGIDVDNPQSQDLSPFQFLVVTGKLNTALRLVRELGATIEHQADFDATRESRNADFIRRIEDLCGSQL